MHAAVEVHRNVDAISDTVSDSADTFGDLIDSCQRIEEVHRPQRGGLDECISLSNGLFGIVGQCFRGISVNAAVYLYFVLDRTS